MGKIRSNIINNNLRPVMAVTNYRQDFEITSILSKIEANIENKPITNYQSHY